MPDTDGKFGNFRHAVGRPWQAFGRRMNYRHIGILELEGSNEQPGSATGVFPYTFPIMFIGSE